MSYDVVIVGGGPGGLQAALTLGRARKQVLLCDAGPRRNAAAVHVHSFVTRDGVTPDEFRSVGRQQLATYPNVQVQDVGVVSISGANGAFQVELTSGRVEARRVLLCTGMIDEMLPVEGFRELWGRSIFQCPYCHGWEVRDRRWGYLVHPAHAKKLLHFALQARAWTRELVVFAGAEVEVPDDSRSKLQGAGIRLETAPVVRLVREGERLVSVALGNGTVVACDVLFTHPPQRQVDLVRSLGLAVDENGFVQVDAMTSQTSVSGIYAAGDLASPMQGAIWAAAAAGRAAAMINAELTAELVTTGAV